MIWAALAAAAVALALHLQLALFATLPRRALRVLMYHRVTAAPGGQRERLTMPVVELRRQIAWLRKKGYELVSLRRVLDALEGDPPLPARAVLLTFDDGTADALEVVRPLLAELTAQAALFVVPGWAGQEREEGGRRQRYLGAESLQELAATLEVGLHGHDHRDLGTLEPADVEVELRRAVTWLKEHNVPHLPALAYPYGA